ncbi:HAD-IIB family hydrolase [Lacisediminihabitans changchengi]|uniref:HAD family phosphatase n=1 Tax=Lacisediminihabitans changchengi TaxID=2787634 RepID=A0A934W3G1_9MICO|nr:HAD family hydrolase [Lacisediminihabitans changchengi]MBK4348933.1 HAD family phosphatase [Lacisediminihabitans changchengi]
MSDRLLIALDVDGTVMREDGVITPEVIAAVHHARDLGHEVMLATGRSVSMTLPVLDRLGIEPTYVVCANGAITLQRDPGATTGYSQAYVETFSPREVLTTISQHLTDGRYAVEDADGRFRYAGGDFPEAGIEAIGERVDFEDLLDREATRVVVLSPGHDLDDFLAVVEKMGLHKVSYNVGWTAWLDIAPDGVNKATALERVRELLGFARTDVVAMGDGRNDIDMLEWASAEGRGIAMGQAPLEVLDASNETTGTDIAGGAAQVLAAL